jgi:hypothetical protein
MAEKKRLTSENAKLAKITPGTAYDGDGVDTLDELAGGAAASGEGEGWYMIVTMAASSGIPSELAANKLWWDDGTTVLETGDSVQPIDATTLSDIQSFSFEFSTDEIEVTTLSDEFKVYELGKTDMTGSLEGVMEIGTTDVDGGVLNSFIDVIRQASDGTITYDPKDNSPLFIFAYIRKNPKAGQQEGFVFMQVSLLGANVQASGADKQGYTSNVRLAPGDYEPTLYLREKAA